MATIEEMQVKLTLDLNALKAEVAQAKSQINSLGQHVEAQKEPVSKLKESFKELGKTMLEAFAVAEAVSFLKESAKAAGENAAAMAGLDITLKNVTGSSKEQTEAIHKQLEAQALVSNQVASDLVPAYSQLVASTKDSGKAMSLLALAQDVAAQKHKDVTVVAQALARAHAGNSAALNKLAPETKGAADALGILAKESKGAAAAVGNADPMAKMQAQFKLIQETLGKALLPLMTTFSKILVDLMPFIEMMAKFIAKVVTAIQPLIKHLGAALLPALTQLANLFAELVMAILPPLVNILDKVLVPIITFIAGWLGKWWQILGKVITAFGSLTAVLANGVIKTFEALIALFKPAFNFLMPIIDGLLKLAGIKITDKTFKVSAETSGLGALGGSLGLPKVGTTASAASSSSSSAATAEKTLLASLAKIKQNVLDAQKKFNTDLAQLQKDYGIKIAAIQKEYSDKLVAVIQSSKDLLRNAFQQATQIDVGSMFAAQLSSSNTLGSAVMKQVKDGLVTVVSWWGSASSGGGVAGLLKSLEDKLAASKELSNNAAKLAGAGFSQNFIDQIVGQGTDLGNQMASAILASSPETQAALERVFKESETVTLHGVDALATQLYNQQGLATEALKTLYADTEAQFKDALTAANAQFNADSQKLYDDLKKSLDDANTAMQDALQTAADAMGVTVESLKKTYTKELGEISTLIEKVQKDADKALAKAIASAKALAEGAFTQTSNPSLPKPDVTLPTLEDQFQRGAYAAQHANANIAPADSRNAPGSNLSINVTAQTNANAGDIANSIVNSIKLAAPFIISSTPGSIQVAGL